MSSPTGPTPPPPPVYATPVPPTAPEPAGPGLSEPQRLVNVFIAPSKTFEDLKRNASWWVPWVIAAVFGIISAFLIGQKVDLERLAQHRTEQSKFAQQRLEQLSPAQREQAMRTQATILKITLYIRPIFGLLGGLIVAAVLMAVYNFVLGAEVPFQRAMAVVFYASLPLLVKVVLLWLNLFISSDPSGIDPDINPVATNPGFFMDPQQANKFIYYLASGVDVIAIWVTVLMGIGFAKASSNRKPNLGTSMATMFVIYGILVVGGAAIASVF
jgi:Yip1-like protein